MNLTKQNIVFLLVGAIWASLWWAAAKWAYGPRGELGWFASIAITAVFLLAFIADNIEGK